MVQTTGIIEFIQKTGRRWRCAECSKLPALPNSLLTGKITGKMNANSFHLALKVQYLLRKADFSCKFNREFN
jgi:hypothetical protein